MSTPGWTRLGATQSSGRRPCPRQQKMNFKSPSNTNRSRILRRHRAPAHSFRHSFPVQTRTYPRNIAGSRCCCCCGSRRRRARRHPHGRGSCTGSGSRARGRSRSCVRRRLRSEKGRPGRRSGSRARRDPCPEEPERSPSSRGPAAHVMRARLRPERRRAPGPLCGRRHSRLEPGISGVCHPATQRGAVRR